MILILDVLKQRGNWMGPTRIQGKANINQKPFKGMIDRLVQARYVREGPSGKRKIYIITALGSQRLDQLEEIFRPLLRARKLNAL